MHLQSIKYTKLPNGKSSKHERSDKFEAIKEELMEYLKKDLAEGEELPDLTKKLAKNYYDDLQYDVVRDMILDDKVRLDGRGLEDVRPLGYGSRCTAFSTWSSFIYKR